MFSWRSILRWSIHHRIARESHVGVHGTLKVVVEEEVIDGVPRDIKSPRNG
jgi:hypothetical protein